ncbi:hypothetical protein HZS38_08175 [Xenorhabdus nematophila]|jgi:hypothetical protein|uniref:Uncharacterized protein n=4 Tax=Enterobacterales TaxID=91347 RepID=A0A0K2S441_CITFR|nr:MULTISPECIES: hypothetical protein [Gammaproteobacteria]EBO0058367.1 hypothetical protein [Salmonella enterica]EKO3572711.1 hypothetical protein [Vibrio metschnikovii]CEE92457.1 hypothetical protein; putative exported protein [Xenorhabdus nematophila str. Anatoliense]CEF32482.1 hypothetical protein; putative exported protein [Xenorhabdus nematophila str. Websteri]HBC3491259.1 hypothetical protein [Vibrio alginolyticus]HBY0479905.1 hypothetical protein [Klebsiella pneumoniae subsp. pneumoni
MNVTKKIHLLALGLFMTGTAIAAPDVLNDDAKLKNLEKVCPDCEMVAKDVLNLRVQNCQLKDTSSAMMIGTMQNDPMFSFMLAVHTAAGSEAYKTVVGAAGNHVDCENPLNWIKLTQQAIKGGKV